MEVIFEFNYIYRYKQLLTATFQGWERIHYSYLFSVDK